MHKITKLEGQFGDQMRYIKGTDRQQTTMLPEVIDDYIQENNTSRFIDAYVDQLDLVKMEFKYSETKVTGRKPYDPGDLLKLYIYGYLNKIRSSRQLESATYKNIEVMWLLHRLHPDFKTIADFRKDNSSAIKGVCREFIILCKKMDLFGRELIAIDGSKFKASNSNDRNYTKNKLTKLIKEIDKEIKTYLDELDKEDEKEKSVKEHTSKELKEKIDQLKKRKKKLQNLSAEVEQSADGQVSQTDPDSRMMRTNQGRDVCYNVQIVTDEKHKLIVCHEVGNEANDLHYLHKMSLEAKKILEVDHINATADAGYYERNNLKRCNDDHIRAFVPRPRHLHNEELGLYTYKDFTYDLDHDHFQCPAGQILTAKKAAIRRGLVETVYYNLPACRKCHRKSLCTKSKRYRSLRRWVDEPILEEMKQRMIDNPHIIKRRKEIVEHPFGIMKNWMGHQHFLTRGLNNTSTEISLLVLAYNLRRVFNIVNFKELMALVS